MKLGLKRIGLMMIGSLIACSSAYADVSAFGLTINKSSINDLEKTGCEFEMLPNTSELTAYKTDGSCYNIDGLKELLLAFENDKLKFIGATINKDEFKKIKKSIDKKYGKPSRADIPFVGNALVNWTPKKDKDVRIILDSPHMSFEMELDYTDKAFYKKLKNATQQKEQNKADNLSNTL